MSRKKTSRQSSRSRASWDDALEGAVGSEVALTLVSGLVVCYPSAGAAANRRTDGVLARHAGLLSKLAALGALARDEPESAG